MECQGFPNANVAFYDIPGKELGHLLPVDCTMHDANGALWQTAGFLYAGHCF
jgi:hypothetical protein